MIFTSEKTSAPSFDSAGTDGFVRIPLSAVRHKVVQNVELYLRRNQRETPVLYRGADYPMGPEDCGELERRGHKALYVTSSRFSSVEKELFDSLEQFVANESIPPTDRFVLLQLAVAMEVDLAFRLIKSDRLVNLSKRVAANISDLLEESQILPRGLFDVVQHDYYTFTHITNVAGFASLLAEKLGITNSEQRQLIAEGALLHDIGKRFIPSSVLQKPGALSEQERKLIETHTTRGFVELRKNSELRFEQLLMVYQHHERMDGSGYPVGIVGEEIHSWSRLLAVVDVFDAITSNRPYRDPMNLDEAIEFLEDRAGTHFDKEIVQCWTSVIREK